MLRPKKGLNQTGIAFRGSWEQRDLIRSRLRDPSK